jgi:hypothetical protein
LLVVDLFLDLLLLLLDVDRRCRSILLSDLTRLFDCRSLTARSSLSASSRIILTKMESGEPSESDEEETVSLV